MSNAYNKGKRKAGGGGGGGGGGNTQWDGKRADSAINDMRRQREKDLQQQEDERIDTAFAYELYTGPLQRTAYIFNMRQSVCCLDADTPAIQNTCLELYCVAPDGDTFKALKLYEPYFLLAIRDESHSATLELNQYLLRRFEGLLQHIKPMRKYDLSQSNHIATRAMRTYQALYFRNTQDMAQVKSKLLPVIQANQKRNALSDSYMNELTSAASAAENSTTRAYALGAAKRAQMDSVLQCIVDIREYDLPYVTRVAIDCNIRTGMWYDFEWESGVQSAELRQRPDMLERPLLKTCAFDIETTKSPLKFPVATHDQIMMISYMMDDRGYLIVNRSIVSQDIADFEFTPKPEYPGHFSIFNEKNERAVLERFFAELKLEKPIVYVTYNGDYFDWPFIDVRCKHHNMDLRREIGIWEQQGEYMGRFALHMDAFLWVKRDSYLPQGSQGLKAVTKAKLQYDPKELDPEDMLPFASERPQALAAYSVSDAVSTYYLYQKYIHSFIFSLSTIIPMPPSDVLRKGSGTLCELLLMVKAYESQIVCPNKQAASLQLDDFYKGHLLESETYIGGHVECLESGVFRDDLPIKFRLSKSRLAALIDKVDTVMQFAIEFEGKTQLSQVVNYDAVRQEIVSKLQALHDAPTMECTPLIYHLDVGAMYPNIILTNRLQPMAIVTASTCAACDYNSAHNECQRPMQWSWRGKHFPLRRSELNAITEQLRYEPLNKEDAASQQQQSNKQNRGRGQQWSSRPQQDANETQMFSDLSLEMQSLHILKRVKQYSQTVYKKSTIEVVEERTGVICQRENSFYVDTVRDFRDRRYEYKALGKAAKRSLDTAQDEVSKMQARDLIILYDSLQLAHKCILNSFYGYVMRRGARWHSIEMAGIVTQTGSDIIKDARQLVDDIGRPLELDTDGIWCMLPCTFPEHFDLKLQNGKQLRINYPCSMLNAGVHSKYTNHQYQVERKHAPTGTSHNDDNSAATSHNNNCDDSDLANVRRHKSLLAVRDDAATQTQQAAHTLTTQQRNDASAQLGSVSYDKVAECSIYFEVDGPYRAMVLPASLEEGKTLKKRYAVFNSDGSLAELKGFEIKRRGELKLIKHFQENVFKVFLEGSTIQECYAAVGRIGNYWLDVLYSECCDLETEDVFDLITESKNMSEALADYGERKSTAVTCARRLGEFLGSEMTQDAGLNCKYIISRLPLDAPVSERAVPTAIFQAEPAIVRHYLRRWLKDQQLSDFDVRTLLDWSYYIQRLSNAIQKIITIPAAFQHVSNPVERCKHPDWLGKKVRQREESHQQTKLSGYFKLQSKEAAAAADLEDMMQSTAASSKQASTQATPFASPLRQRYAKVTKKQRALTKAGGNNNNVIAIDADDDEDDATGGAAATAAAAAQDTDDEKHDAESEKNDDEVQVITASKNTATEDTDPQPDETNLAAYLPWLKRQWDKQRTRREKERYTAQHPIAGASTSHANDSLSGAMQHHQQQNNAFSMGGGNLAMQNGLSSYFAHQSQALRTRYWQIVQIVPVYDALSSSNASSPGIFRLWVFVDSTTLVQVQVRVERTVYVDMASACSSLASHSAARRCERLLPHSQPVHHLYQVTLSERDWPREQQLIRQMMGNAGGANAGDGMGVNSSTAEQQQQNKVLGVYESQVSLMWRLLMHAGCVCKLESSAASKSKNDTAATTSKEQQQNTFDLSALTYKSINDHPYMSQTQYTKCYLYHSQCTTRNAIASRGMETRAVFGLFIENAQDALVIAVNPYSGVDAAAAAVGDDVNLRSLYGDVLREAHAQDSTQSNTAPPPPKSRMQFTQRQVSSLEHAFKLLSDRLTKHRSQATLPSVLMLQSSMSLRQLYARIPMLLTSYPCIALPAHSQDNVYPVMQWYATAARRMLLRQCTANAWLEHSLELCRYAHVPVGNLTQSHQMFDDDEGTTSSSGSSSTTAASASDEAQLLESAAASSADASTVATTSATATTTTEQDEQQALLQSTAAAQTSYLTLMTDLLYSRSLAHNNHLLWCSGSGPGSAVDSGQLFMQQHCSQALPAVATSFQQDSILEFNYPAVHRNMCVELQLSQLAVNTVLQQAMIEELEGVSHSSTGAAATSSLSNSTQQQLAPDGTPYLNAASTLQTQSLAQSSDACLPAFKIMRQTLLAFFTDAYSPSATGASSQSACAHALLAHFTHWLQSAQSVLYDASLARLIAQLQRKVLLQLMHRFTVLGSTVVHASATKLILSCGGKQSMPHVASYLQFVLDTVRQRPLFQWCQLELIRVYRALHYMDSHNFGALLTEADQQLLVDNQWEDAELMQQYAASMESTQSDNASQQQLHTLSQWNMCSYLPLCCHSPFQTILSDYLLLPYQFMHENLMHASSSSASGASGNHNRMTNDERTTLIHSYCQQHIAQKLYQQMLHAIDAIQHAQARDQEAQSSSSDEDDEQAQDDDFYSQSDDNNENHDPNRHASRHHRRHPHRKSNKTSQFPQLAGSHLHMTDPSLEFIKFTLHAIGLDATLLDNVNRLKASLLKMCHAFAFAASSQFQNPCLTLVLPSYVCSYCHTVRCLDLCRDACLAAHQWQCLECAHSIDKSMIESQLCATLQYSSAAYQQQDCVCKSCGSIQQNLLNSYCACSGEYETQFTSPAAFAQQVALYSNVARFHQMSQLRQVCEWIHSQHHLSSSAPVDAEYIDSEDEAELAVQRAQQAQKTRHARQQAREHQRQQAALAQQQAKHKTRKEIRQRTHQDGTIEESDDDYNPDAETGVLGL